MNNSFLNNMLDVCGFYELDASGAVLYSRVRQDGKFDKPDLSIVGLNFFEKILGCQNSESLRRRFTNFVSCRNTTETFIFGYQISESFIPLRVMFVRISERTSNESNVCFYIDIKPD